MSHEEAKLYQDDLL